MILNLRAHSKNDDLDEGETARLGEDRDDWPDCRSEDSFKRDNFNSKTIYMRWMGGRESSNVDDRRGLSAGVG